MTQDNEHVQKLIAARDREVAYRRDIAERLAEKYNRSDTEAPEAFIKNQDAIEAIERAVWHERYIAGEKSGPSCLSASEADSTASARCYQLMPSPAASRRPGMSSNWKSALS